MAWMLHRSVQVVGTRAWNPSAGISKAGFDREGDRIMLQTVAVILLILWLLGLVSGYTIGAFIHVLLVIAIVLFLVGLVSGRRIA